MRRQIIALAAAACLATTACSTTDPTETPTPTDVATSAVESTDPAATETTTTDSETAEASPTGSQSETSGASPTAPQSSPGEATAEDVDLATQSFAISPQDAIDMAVEKAGGGFANSIELDWSRYHGAWVYELNVLMGTMDHDLDINADTGEVLELERDETDDVEQAIDLNSPMTWETARDNALNAVSGQITSWKLEYDDDDTAYEFDIRDSSGDEIEVEVNVNTGSVQIDD